MSESVKLTPIIIQRPLPIESDGSGRSADPDPEETYLVNEFAPIIEKYENSGGFMGIDGRPIYRSDGSWFIITRPKYPGPDYIAKLQSEINLQRVRQGDLLQQIAFSDNPSPSAVKELQEVLEQLRNNVTALDRHTGDHPGLQLENREGQITVEEISEAQVENLKLENFKPSLKGAARRARRLLLKPVLRAPSVPTMAQSPVPAQSPVTAVSPTTAPTTPAVTPPLLPRPRIVPVISAGPLKAPPMIKRRLRVPVSVQLKTPPATSSIARPTTETPLKPPPLPVSIQVKDESASTEEGSKRDGASTEVGSKTGSKTGSKKPRRHLIPPKPLRRPTATASTTTPTIPTTPATSATATTTTTPTTDQKGGAGDNGSKILVDVSVKKETSDEKVHPLIKPRILPVESAEGEVTKDDMLGAEVETPHRPETKSLSPNKAPIPVVIKKKVRFQITPKSKLATKKEQNDPVTNASPDGVMSTLAILKAARALREKKIPDEILETVVRTELEAGSILPLYLECPDTDARNALFERVLKTYKSL